MKNTVLLIGFYNEKALGVKYIAHALEKSGYIPHILFLKEYNSVAPSKISRKEFALLLKLLEKIKPDYVGLSVMSSLYLESVLEVNAITDLLDTLNEGGDISLLCNLAFKRKDKTAVVNPVRTLIQDPDSLGFPKTGEGYIYFINRNRIIYTDPQLTGATYETSASRGCPFTCSYCSSVNLKRIYKGKGRFVRTRSVDNIISELTEAKNKIPNLSLIRFWDEIFPDEDGWVEEFKERYRKEINIPFNIWGHPQKISEHIIKNLLDAGLNQIVVGIQSGSTHIRKEIFHRNETQEQIIEASRILSDCRIPSVVYDFMLQHPFETINDLKDTFDLCMKLKHPFELQLHGLNFLPGTDITDMAIKSGMITDDKMEKLMYGSMQNQYDMYWGSAGPRQQSVMKALIYMTQFQSLRPLLEIFEKRISHGRSGYSVLFLQRFFRTFSRIRHGIRKVRLVQKKNE